jgi:hypothetical protein
MTKPSHVLADYDLPILATVRRYLCLRRGRTNWFRGAASSLTLQCLTPTTS